MQTKLTLELEDELIRQIETYAKYQNKSVSQLVTDYFQQISQQSKKNDIPPITQSLIGILQNHPIEEGDYKQYLQDKYL